GVRGVSGGIRHGGDRGGRGGAAHLDAPAPPAVDRTPVLSPSDVLIEFTLFGRAVRPFTAARDEQAAVGQLAAVNHEGAAALLVKEPHTAVNLTPGHLNQRQSLPAHRP